MDKELFNTVYAQAIRFLNVRFLSYKELYDKLSRKQHEVEIIEAVLNKLIEQDYINDERLAKAYLKNLINEGKYGIYGIKNKMFMRGLEIDNDILASYYEYQAAYNQLSKKYKQVDAKNKDKSIRFLLYRGFSSSIAYKASSDYFEES